MERLELNFTHTRVIYLVIAIFNGPDPHKKHVIGKFRKALLMTIISGDWLLIPYRKRLLFEECVSTTSKIWCREFSPNPRLS